MKHQLLRTASVCALIVAMGGVAFAQTGGSGGGGGGGSGGAPASPSQQQKSPGSGGGEIDRQGGAGSGEAVRPKDGSAGPPSERQPGSAQSEGRDRQRTGQDQQRGQDKDRQRTGQEQRGQDKDRQRTGQEQRGQDKDRQRTGQDQRGQDKDRTRQGQAERERGGGTQLSEQQRTSVRERFTRGGVERNRVNDVNFDIRVGASVPRSVVLHPLPTDVVDVVPAYRGYRYVYVRDEIVIVNPATFAVVAVVSGSGNRAAGVRDGRVTLAAPDRVFVRDHIDRGAAIRLGIGNISIGMTVPQGVELLPLPTVVIDRVPDLREYRYFVYDDDIAIVDPASDEVVLIVEK